MAKNKRKNISDVKLSKQTQKKQNPFEVHINREKFKVLGQKSKFDKGLPGVARAKAVKKRKETLLQEYKLQDKSNKFIDRRIGERNKAMTAEDKIMARFTAERMKVHKRKTMFNLAEEEVLTHKGRSITEVERFDDPRSDDDDDDGNTGALDANFVEEAHFGGGIFTKSKNNRESVIDQLIADSKKRKIERQQTREKTLELTEKLDSEWKDLIPIIASGHKNDDEEEIPNKGRGDPFDIAMKELKFEARGKPSDKLKSEEEIAEKEAKRLQELEEERLRRMRGEDTQINVTKKHRSADDLDDNFQLDDGEDFSLMYDLDGNLILPKDSGEDNAENDEETTVKSTGSDVVSKNDDDEEEEDDEDDDEEEDEEDDDIDDLKEEIEACNKEEDESENENSDDEIQTKQKETKQKETVSDNSDIDNSKNRSLTNKSGKHQLGFEAEKTEMDGPVNDFGVKKRKSSESSPNDSNIPLKKPNVVETTNKNQSTHLDKISLEKVPIESTKGKKKKVCFDDVIEEVEFGQNAMLNQNKKTNEIREELMRRKELMDKARKELPFTYEAPKSYEDLQELFKGHDNNEVIVIVERIIKCNHPKLREENKQKMSSLFAFLMQYLNDLDNEECWTMLNRLVPFLYDLMLFSPSNTAECIAEIIKEKQSDYAEKKYKYPTSSTMMFLKLVPLLFPGSDKRHPVTTPSLVFIIQMLQSCKVTNRRSISSGLFLVTLIYEFVHLSKRICPQVLNFLTGLLHLASPSNIKPCIVPPFKAQHRFLYLQKPFSQQLLSLKLDMDELSPTSSKIDDEFRIKSVHSCLKLLDLFLDLYEMHPASYLLFQPLKNYLDSFEVSKYPDVFKEEVTKIQTKLKKLYSQELEKISVAAKKPKTLRLYQPSVEPVYDTKKKKGVSAEKAEQDKLLHKIKREKKGALREIRRDKSFIAKIKFKQQQKSDVERIRKVKEIYSWGAQQQGEMNALERFKKKKR